MHVSWPVGRDWFLVFGLICVATRADAWWVTLPCVISIGLVQYAIGEALLHEASHYHLFRGDRRWNDFWGALCALPFFTTLRDWRAEHLQHHRRFGTVDDHIVQDYAAHRLTGPSPHIGWVWFGKPLLGLTIFRHLHGLGEINSAGGWMKIAAFWIPVLTVCRFQHLLAELALYWFVPQLTVFATLLHWSEIGDHYRTRNGSRSRTGRFHNWLFHNNGYHAVHHRFPAVPFTELASVHGAPGPVSSDVTRGWWGVWRQISRPGEPRPEQWAAFWPEDP